jgi:hypothetical protein
MSQVRAKFRCMSVLKKWDGSTIVEFSVVLQKGENPENATFWKFTPSGDATLNFRGPSFDDRGKEYSPGDYYYVDMRHDPEDGGWHLSEVTHNREDCGRVELCANGKKNTGWNEGAGWTYGKMSMGLDHAPALAWFAPAGEEWSVSFKWAEASDG